MEYMEVVDRLKEAKRRLVKYIVVIPTYNERGNIDLLLKRLKEDVIVEFEILIIDDNSPDGTADRVIEQQKYFSNLHLICRKTKLGLGSAYKLGFTIACEVGFDYIISMDADLSHEPNIINKFVDEIRSYDLVIGSRFLSESKLVNFFFIRRMISFIVRLLTGYILNLNISDPSSSFRCYRREVLETIDVVGSIHNKGYIFIVEILFYIKQKKFNIKEIPIKFTERVYGNSKVNLIELLSGLYAILSIKIEHC